MLKITYVNSIDKTFFQFWKVKKVLRATFHWSGLFPKIHFNSAREESKEEATTRKYDEECMKYLSYLLYPLCIVGAVYSLFFQPHKRYNILPPQTVRCILFIFYLTVGIRGASIV